MTERRCPWWNDDDGHPCVCAAACDGDGYEVCLRNQRRARDVPMFVKTATEETGEGWTVWDDQAWTVPVGISVCILGSSQMCSNDGGETWHTMREGLTNGWVERIPGDWS